MAGGGHPGAFVITLGAHGEDGAVVISRWNGTRPGPGTYGVGAEPAEDGVTALVVTGSPHRPGGVFRARHGTVTITRSSATSLAGRFELQARGFLVSEPGAEGRELTVSGSFTAAADDRASR